MPKRRKASERTDTCANGDRAAPAPACRPRAGGLRQRLDATDAEETAESTSADDSEEKPEETNPGSPAMGEPERPPAGSEDGGAVAVGNPDAEDQGLGKPGAGANG